MPDTVTLMQYDAGELDAQEIVEMLAEMIAEQGLDSLEDRFITIAQEYVDTGVLDEEGNINYIKLRQEV